MGRTGMKSHIIGLSTYPSDNIALTTVNDEWKLLDNELFLPLNVFILHHKMQDSSKTPRVAMLLLPR